MSCHRYAAKRDDAEAEVVKAFEEGGASVARLSGKDIPDLAIGYLGQNHLVEVKTDRARLTDGQTRWADLWLGERPIVARTAAQARKWLRAWASGLPTLGTVLRANQALLEASGGGVDAAMEDHEDLTAERARTEEP